MTTPLQVNTTDVTDTTSTGSTRLNDAANTTDDDNTTGGGDPRVRESLTALRKKTAKSMRESSTDMDTANSGARRLEQGDASGARNANNVTTPRYTAAPTAAAPQYTPTAMPAMTPASTAGMMAGQMVPTALNTGASMATSVAQPAAQTMYALTPNQQQALIQTVANNNGTSGGTDLGEVPQQPSLNGTGSGRFDEIVKRVLAANIPYAWGGGTLEGPSKGISDGGGAADANGDYNKTGFDCSGLSRYMYYQDTGVEIPRTSEAQYAASAPVSNPQPGDLVFPQSAGRPPGHVQVYIGNDQVIEAPQSGMNIRVTGMAPDSEVRRPTGSSS